MRIVLLLVAAALTGSVATGCGTAKPLSVVAHPVVRSSGLPKAPLHGLRADNAVLLSPSQVAFLTSGTVSCVWWPKRLTVVNASEIRIDMRVNGRVTSCGSGGAAFPIAVKIDPRVVDVRRPVTVRLDYEVHVGGRTRQWSKTVVAPAVSRS